MTAFKSKNVFLSFALTISLLSGSCAFNNDRKDSNRKEQEETQEKFAANCAALQGVYAGTMTTSTATYPVEAGINCEQQPWGNKTDSYGKPIMVAVPYMTLARKDIAKRVSMQLAYDDYNGSISNIGTALNLDENFNATILGSIQTTAISGISGFFDGNTISAQVNAAIPVGTLTITKDTTKVFSVEDDVSFKKMIKSLATKLSQFEGKYCGYFKVTLGDYEYIHSELIISMRQDGEYLYTMSGQYNRHADSEGDSSGILNSKTNLLFDFDTPAVKMSVVSVPKAANSYRFKMYGQFDGENYYGTYYEDLVGTTANFYLIKKNYSSKKPPTSCYTEAKKKLDQLFPKN